MKHKNISCSPLNFSSDTDYDLIITTVGFEKRSRYIAEEKGLRSPRKCAFSFEKNQTLSYSKNRSTFQKLGYEIIDVAEGDFGDALGGVLRSVRSSQRKVIRIAIDISSMTRKRIALTVKNLFFDKTSVEFCVDYLYAIAKYSPPSEPGPINFAGPVIPEFAGWPEDPDVPSSCVVGIGYEENRALGALEYIEPGEIWIWRPKGMDERFFDAVNLVNEIIIRECGDGRIMDYEVLDPYASFVRLESQVYGLLQRSRPVLVPFGPKIFCLLMMLTSAMRYPRVSVWRVSGETYEKPKNLSALGPLTGISVNFS